MAEPMRIGVIGAGILGLTAAYRFTRAGHQVTVIEREGDVGNVTFPCGYTLEADGDTINLYYGAADTSIALASGSVRQLLDWLDQHGRE